MVGFLSWLELFDALPSGTTRQDMKGQLRVSCRIRPLSAKEKAQHPGRSQAVHGVTPPPKWRRTISFRSFSVFPFLGFSHGRQLDVTSTEAE